MHICKLPIHFLTPILDKMANHTKKLRGRYFSVQPNMADLQPSITSSMAWPSNTRITYNIDQYCFLAFYQAKRSSTLPASETILTTFITYLAAEKIPII